MRMPWQKDGEGGTTLEGGEIETKDGEVGEPKKTASSSDPPPTDTGVQGPFNSGPLAGMTAQEAADRLALQEITITEQKAAVDGVPTTVAPPEPVSEPVQVSSEEFFQDPGKAIREITADTIQSQMKEIVSELRQDMAVGKVKSAWDDAAGSIPNLSNMRPLIEARLSQNGVNAPNVASIIAVNDMLVGEATRRGTPIPTIETRVEPGSTDSTRVIPQHSVSTQPLATSIEKKVEYEPLDENEARMAREKKMTHEQYRQWQAIDIGDVLAEVPEKVS